MQWPCLFTRALIVVFASLPLSAPGFADDSRDPTFGFDGMHIFKFHKGVGPIAFGDFDADGRQDLAVMNNFRGELVLLHQDPEGKGRITGEGANTLNDPDGYRRETVLVQLNVHAMLCHDLNQDGWTDLLLFGSQQGIEVRWGAEESSFRERNRYRVTDGVPSPHALALLEGDEGPEVFLLAKKGVHRYRHFSRERSPDHSFLAGSAPKSRALHLADLNRDGTRDLITIVSDPENPYRLRLGRDDGAFGAEYILRGFRINYALPVETREGTSLVALPSGRARFHTLALDVKKTTDPLDLPAPEIHPLDASGLEEPRMLVADLDGDGDVDVAISHRKESSILLFLNEGGDRRRRPSLIAF
ncbi:MAG: VCBS repeat-containing protein, partial [Planctomycetota bacterium]|nr:VCBS repeat-containing protein [Planctomycetota bacterium]